MTTLASLATVIVLALTGNGEAAIAVAAAGTVGVLGGAIHITVNIRR